MIAANSNSFGSTDGVNREIAPNMALNLTLALMLVGLLLLAAPALAAVVL